MRWLGGQAQDLQRQVEGSVREEGAEVVVLKFLVETEAEVEEVYMDPGMEGNVQESCLCYL